MNNLEEILIPISVFISITLLFVALLIYQYKTKRMFLKTVENAISQEQPITPEVIKEVARHFYSSSKDLRKGIMLIVVTLAILIFSWLVDFPQNGAVDLNDMINGIAAFPGLFGLAYLLLHQLDKKT
ncbi:DUF6249 domain-containing protein [Aliikangiella sp. G2MR2-5]|uniref:DUF6249 domain-containing protein n=1 Tax=Aliikangiella sp. G2MR2-5 TaxID=2788943 RepID=UPI0018AAE71C|nr:DUF6249 domain-containing protein [Aliikangiella sp. G2MR2-5]